MNSEEIKKISKESFFHLGVNADKMQEELRRLIMRDESQRAKYKMNNRQLAFENIAR